MPIDRTNESNVGRIHNEPNEFRQTHKINVKVQVYVHDITYIYILLCAQL